ncbi:VCBS repeat-containing protein [bacterium]|nr:VCBS repeat-containing protein [bacterium]
MGAVPQVADINGDDRFDLLVGDRNGVIWIYYNIGSKDSPVFSAGVRLNYGAGPLDVGANSCPVVIDWNNDGLKDLIIGNESFRVLSYINTGTVHAPIFDNSTPYTTVLYSNSFYRCHPEVLDLDRDGKKDLLVSQNNGNVYFYKNLGTDVQPYFTSPENSLKLTDERDLIVSAGGAHMEMADWNNDGLPDLITGDWNGNITVFLQEAATAVYNDTPTPKGFLLNPNFPNPFNMSTVISYEIPKAEKINITIYDILGNRIRTLVSEYQSAGLHKIQWNGRNSDDLYSSSGIYMVVMQCGEWIDRQKITLMK